MPLNHIFLIFLFVFPLSGLTGCGGGDSDSVAPTATVARSRIERIVVASGTVEPERNVEVRPRIAGIIETIHVEPGDLVAPRQPLIEIERDLLVSQAREAEAALQEARIERRYAKIELDRQEELRRGGVTSSQDYDAARAASERAQAQVLRAEARHQTLSTQLGYATVVSSFAGRVLDVHVEEGSAVSPVTAVTGGTLLLTLAGTEKLYLEGLVDENEITRVALGQEARIRTEAYSDRTFRGIVSEIAPLGQRIQNVTYFEIDIEIVDEDAQLLRPRMSGDADIITETVPDALVIPETALRYRGEQIYVETRVQNSASRVETKDVEIGIVDGTRVQVLSGLDEGDVVQLQ